MSSKIPCENCITLAICKASLQGYYEKEPHSQVAALARLMFKCDLIDYYAHTKENEHRDLDAIIVDRIRELN